MLFLTPELAKLPRRLHLSVDSTDTKPFHHWGMPGACEDPKITAKYEICNLQHYVNQADGEDSLQ